MFDLGIQELIVIFVVALLVVGPKRLPEIARSMGKGLAELKKSLDGVKSQINSEMGDVKDIKELKDLKDLDPISLKNQLFKSEDLLKVEETSVQPSKEVAPKDEPKNASDKVADKTDEHPKQDPGIKGGA